MAYYFPEGSKFYFSETFAAAKTVSALSNANPAVATSTAHGYSDGDIILLTSGWEDATNSLYKVDATGTDTFTLVDFNTSDTDWYAAGTGTGTAEKVSSWLEIPQVLSISSSGGDARYTTINPLAKRNAINVPTGFNPVNITLTLGHDPAGTNYASMLDISRTLRNVAFKMVLGGGAVTYGYGYMTVGESPSLNVNQANTVTASLSILGRSISYTS